MASENTALRLLLVDDELDFLRALATALTTRGMVVRTAHSGPDAIAMHAAARPDVIVLDLRMPGMDGLATLEAIRVVDGITPVLLLSGHADVEGARAALAAGAVDFLLKPCAVETLASAIEDAHERRGVVSELAERAQGPRPTKS